MIVLAALLLVQTAPATAQATQATQCKAPDASLPTPLLGWTAPGDEFTPDKAVSLDTVDASALKGLPAGTKPGKAATIGFKIATAGTYGIALDQPGWIDVLPGASGGTALTSVAHGHGPDCSTIKKIVRFKLDPGTYRLYVTGLAQAKAKVMLVVGS
ncbi:MAG: hypothetical protein ABW023_15525 [Sphingomonas sp.]